MTTTNQLDTPTVVLLILGTLIVLPFLTMGMGFGGMMGYGGMMGGYGSTGGWWSILGSLVPILFLLVLVGGGYVLLRRTNEDPSGQDAAIAELRRAYARGDLSDEEFERRRERLGREG